MRCACIDIGTNTIRLLIADLSDGRIKKLHREQLITRLGENLKRNKGYLSEDSINRTISGIDNFLQICKRYKVENIHAVATSAARSSLNGDDFIKNVESVTGILPRIITGYEEALLTIRGILCTLHLDTRNIFIMDIGGGSTEYSLFREGKLVFISSIDIGVLNLAGEYNVESNVSRSVMKLINSEVTEALNENIKQIVNMFDPSETVLVTTSGTPLTIASICKGLDSFDTPAIDGTLISRQSIVELLNDLANHSSLERLEKFGAIIKGRENIIIPGTVILLCSMNALGFDNMTVTENSLLEGMLLTDKCLKKKGISLYE